MTGDKQSFFHKIKVIMLLVLLGILLIFALQNSEEVTVAFLFWDLTLPRIFIFFNFFCVGTLFGIFVNTIFSGRQG